MENNDSTKFKYFRIGDIVLDCEGSIWGNRRFTIASFFGVRWNPMCLGYFTGCERSWKTHSNLCIKNIILVGARVRPMSRVNQAILVKLIKAGNVEAKREFIIRSNVAKYKNRLKGYV